MPAYIKEHQEEVSVTTCVIVIAVGYFVFEVFKVGNLVSEYLAALCR